jgi:hypothetical protein
MKREIEKIIPLTYVLFVVSFFTILSIPLSFKYLGLKGLFLPILGCLFIFYFGFKIENLRRHHNIRSAYELISILNNKTPNSKISSLKARYFLEKGLLAFLAAFVISMLLIIVSFIIFG